MIARNSALLAIVGLCLCATMALAQDAPPERKYEAPTEADIAIGNTLFFRIRTAAAGYTVAERQKIVNDRLIDIFQNNDPYPVTIGCIRGKPTLYVDGVQLITVYERDAKANGCCMKQLATAWAKRLEDGLTYAWPGCRYKTVQGEVTEVAADTTARPTGPTPPPEAVPDVPEATTGK